MSLKFACDMPSVCLTFTGDMPKICLRFSFDLPVEQRSGGQLATKNVFIVKTKTQPQLNST